MKIVTSSSLFSSQWNLWCIYKSVLKSVKLVISSSQFSRQGQLWYLQVNSQDTGDLWYCQVSSQVSEICYIFKSVLKSLKLVIYSSQFSSQWNMWYLQVNSKERETSGIFKSVLKSIKLVISSSQLTAQPHLQVLSLHLWGSWISNWHFDRNIVPGTCLRYARNAPLTGTGTCTTVTSKQGLFSVQKLILNLGI